MLFKNVLILLFMVSFSACFAADKGKGKVTFDTKCALCHSIGQGDKIGPDLKGVTKRRSIDWIKKMVKDPETMLKTDPVAKELFIKYKNVPMIKQGLTDQEIEDVIAYLKTQ